MENFKKAGESHRTGESRRDYGTSRSGRKHFINKSVSSSPAASYRSERVNFSDEDRSYGNSGRRHFNSDNRPRRTGNWNDRSSYGDRPQNIRRDRTERNFGGRTSFGGERMNRRNAQTGRPEHASSRNRQGKRIQKPVNKTRSNEGINRMIKRYPQLDASQYSDNDYINIPVKEEVRLNKFIANSGICSRREADNYILAGVVTVNGNVVTELGSKININTDDVRFNGERLKGEEKVYVVLNKPKGYVTTSSDPHAEKTVMDLLTGCKARIFPVGRLDKNTTGVLMFTNDGEMAEKLTHPSYNKKKIYQVNLDNKLSREDYDKIMEGVTLSDGEIAADELEYIDENDHRKIGISIHSGKNRIVRRIFESLGYEVKALDRVYFAGLTKQNLKRGAWRYLSEGEVNILRMGAYN